MRYFLCAIMALMVACGSAPEPASTEAPIVASAAAPITSHHRQQFDVEGENYVTINCGAGKFGHPTAFGAQGGHAGAPLVGVGPHGAVAKYGAVYNGSDITPGADVWNQNVPHSGVARMTLQCETLSDFGGSGGAASNSEDPAYYFSWGAGTPLVVSDAKPLWDGDSACWIDNFSGLSAVGEKVQLSSFSANVPSGWQWQLNVSGYRFLAGGAQCAWLGRPLGRADTFHLYRGAAPQFATSPDIITGANGTCFIHQVSGNADDGNVIFKHDGNWLDIWSFELNGDVDEAEGYCVRYLSP